MELKFNVANVRKALYSSVSKKPNEQTIAFFGEVVEVVKLLNKQLEKNTHNHLNISDTYLKEELNIEARKAKRIRMKLKEVGAIKINEVEVNGKTVVQKQTGKGTYPNWVPAINKELNLVKVIEDDKKATRKTTPVEARYIPAYCVQWHREVEEAREFGLFEIFGVEQAMVMIHINMNEWIASQGLTRDDFRL